MYPTAALVSPDVHPDRTVTFRFSAPEATAVFLVGEINRGKGPQPMSKDDAGIWSVTVGPLPPEIWIYNFRVQGLDVVDPSNPSIKPVPPGQTANSFVEVPGKVPALYDYQPVPHGQVRMILYESRAMAVTRWVWVYTPPDYDTTSTKYPVLYLLHGNGEDQSGWVRNGRANIVLDNLIAEHKVKPMIVVMPQGHALQGASVGPVFRLQGEKSMFSPRFPADLIEDVLPLVETQFRTIPDADHRAIAGLSMGGAQSLEIGLTHLDLFHYVMGFSAAIGAPFLDIDQQLQNFYANPEVANKKLRLLAVYCGKQDFVQPGNLNFVQALHQHNIKSSYTETEGAHVWSVWRKNLAAALPLLFMP
jgi:enterochelin esterase-like enzyme